MNDSTGCVNGYLDGSMFGVRPSTLGSVCYPATLPDVLCPNASMRPCISIRHPDHESTVPTSPPTSPYSISAALLWLMKYASSGRTPRRNAGEHYRPMRRRYSCGLPDPHSPHSRWESVTLPCATQLISSRRFGQPGAPEYFPEYYRRTTRPRPTRSGTDAIPRWVPIRASWDAMPVDAQCTCSGARCGPEGKSCQVLFRSHAVPSFGFERPVLCAASTPRTGQSVLTKLISDRYASRTWICRKGQPAC